METLEKKTRQFEAITAMCKVNVDEALEDIASSVEIANKPTESLQSQDKTKDPYLQWWDIFLKEWNDKCFRRCLANAETQSLKSIRDWELWFGRFNALWVWGCDMVRITRLNDLKETISRVIARESPSKSDIEEIWRWHNESTKRLDEAVVKMIDLCKQKQIQAFAQTLKELREFDKDSLLGKLKRLISE